MELWHGQKQPAHAAEQSWHRTEFVTNWRPKVAVPM